MSVDCGTIVTAAGGALSIAGALWTARSLARAWKSISTPDAKLVIEPSRYSDSAIGFATAIIENPAPSWNLAILERRVAEGDRRVRDQMTSEVETLKHRIDESDRRIRSDLDDAIAKWNREQEASRARTAADVKDGFVGLIVAVAGAGLQALGVFL